MKIGTTNIKGTGKLHTNIKDGFSIFHLGGCGQIMGGFNLFPDNELARRRFAPPHSREFFPDIGLLARRNFAHTIQDLL